METNFISQNETILFLTTSKQRSAEYKLINPDLSVMVITLSENKMSEYEDIEKYYDTVFE